MQSTHPQRRSRRAIVVATAAMVAAGTTLALAPAATAAPAGTVTIAHTAPSWLSHAQKPTGVSRFAAAPQSVRVYLAPQGGLDALKASAADLSNPSSANYGKWLTTAQYNAKFAPTKSSVDSVSSYLSSKGLTVNGVSTGNRYVTATGQRDQLNSAFGVNLQNFSHDGQNVVAPDSDVVLPAAVGSSVLTVTGLDTTVFKQTHDSAQPDVTPPAGFVNGRPCSIYFGQVAATYQADYKTPLPQFKGQTLPYAPCGYTGAQYRAAYEGDTTLTGAGVTVAITDAYSWQKIASDANTYAQNHGDGAYRGGQLSIVESPTGYHDGKLDPPLGCGASGWSGEETLDVEAVHAMAPAANIKYFASASCFDTDFLDTLGRVVDDNTAKIVSNSWGEAEQDESSAAIAAYEQVLLQGAMQGITFLWSSGDSGDELQSSGLKQADYPASDPYVTGVGGTSTAIGASGAIDFQTGWGTQKYSLSSDGKSWTPVGYLYGAGGGYSALFNRPTYQNGVVPSSAPPGRAVPDVAMDADPQTGMLIGQTQTFPDGVHYGEYRIGGTSLASPLFAGMMALKVQGNKGQGFGLANPTIYKNRAQFTDVKATPNHLGVVRSDYVNANDPSKGILYSVRTFNQDATLATVAGWDPVTGVGVPSPAFIGAKATASGSGSSGTSGASFPGHPMSGTPSN